MLILCSFMEAAFSEGSHTIMIACLVFVVVFLLLFVGWFVCFLKLSSRLNEEELLRPSSKDNF